MDVSDYMNQYVTGLKDAGAIRSKAVEAAFRRVQRHRFIEGYYQPSTSTGALERTTYERQNPTREHLARIYSDQSLVTDVDDGAPLSSASQPSVVASMIEALELSPGMTILEIGTGTGYNAALMAELVGNPGLVTSVEVDEEVFGRTRRLMTHGEYWPVNLVLQDGFYGSEERAPYDRIIATVGCPDISPYWAKQLSPSGSMLIPLSHGGSNPLVRVWTENENLYGEVVDPAAFVPMRGELSMEGSWWTFQSRPELEDSAVQQPWFEGLSSDSQFDFGFYLALREPRAGLCSNPYGYGLFDECGTVLICPQLEKVLSTGVPVLYQRLQQIYQEWKARGAPSPYDFLFCFIPVGEPANRRDSWRVERRFFQQLCSLRPEHCRSVRV